MKLAPNGINTMYFPCQTLLESLFSRQRFKGFHLVFLLSSVRKMQDNTKQNRVHTVLKGIINLLQGIRCKPIITVNKTDILTRCLAKCHVSCMRKSCILLQESRFNTLIPLCILLKDSWGGISRPIINAQNFNIRHRLCQQRIQTLWQIISRIVDCNEYTNLCHDRENLFLILLTRVFHIPVFDFMTRKETTELAQHSTLAIPHLIHCTSERTQKKTRMPNVSCRKA